MPEQPADLNVKVDKSGGMTIWQAAGTLGIGSVLVLLIVPRLMTSGEQSQTFIQEKMITTLEKVAESDAEATAEWRSLGGKVDRAADKVDELADRMAPLVGRLDKVAEAVTEQVEQRDAETKAETEQ
jgi:hypothetical protein